MSTMTDEAFSLSTPDGKKIHGILTRAEKPSGKVVILAHGLTGNPSEYVHIIARDFFSSRGYDVVRFSFYGETEGARKLHECTIETHAQDLRSVFAFVTPHYAKSFVIGHSYGGLSMLYANVPAAALAFWDSSFRIYDSHWSHRVKALRDTTIPSISINGYDLVLNPMMIEVDKESSVEVLTVLARKILSPSLVVVAEESRGDPTRAPLFGALACPKKTIEIAHADHCFTNGQTVYDLLNATLDWFNQH